MKVLPMLVAAGLMGVVPALVAGRPVPPAGAAQAGFVVASPDDPPKKDKASKRGTPTGKVEGGTGGSEFRDKATGRLAKVTARGGSWVDAVRCTWDDDGDLDDGTNHGGSGGEETVLKLEPGESLVQVSGTLLTMDDTTVIGSLSFKTTKRTVGPVGESTDGKTFTLDAPKGQEICGFQGRSSDYLDAIGLVCRPLP